MNISLSGNTLGTLIIAPSQDLPSSQNVYAENLNSHDPSTILQNVGSGPERIYFAKVLRCLKKLYSSLTQGVDQIGPEMQKTLKLVGLSWSVCLYNISMAMSTMSRRASTVVVEQWPNKIINIG